VSPAPPGVLAGLLPSRALLRPSLLACFGITAAVHFGTVLLNTLLPLHVTALGGTKTQVGLLFSVTTLVGMFLRPLIGGWVDRLGPRRVIVPGTLLLLATSLAFHLAGTPGAVIVLMAGIGISASLISTPASVHAATSGPATLRGEALGTYYLFSSLPIAIAPPLALAMFRTGGIRLGFAVVSAMALLIAALTLPLAPPPAGSGPARAMPRQLLSRHAYGLSGVLILTTCGHSAVYGFLPLYAIARGQGAALSWFFGVYSVWLILCRALFRSVSDRIGRTQVLAPAIGMLVIGYACLALPPSLPSLVAAALCLGSGGSLMYPTLIALVVDRAPPDERGLAMGTISGAWDVGIVIGSAVVGLVIEKVGYGAGFATGAAGAAAGLTAFLVMEHRRVVRPGRENRAHAAGRGSGRSTPATG
jgi:MFS family permease